MTKAELKTQIQNLADETNSTFIQAASALQAQAAKVNNEELIEAVGALKLEYLEL